MPKETCKTSDLLNVWIPRHENGRGDGLGMNMTGFLEFLQMVSCYFLIHFKTLGAIDKEIQMNLSSECFVV